MTTMTCPPGITNAGLDSVFGFYSAVVKASIDYWTGAQARRATPLDIGLDLLDWINAVTRRDEPRWTNAFTVVADWPVARLLDFSVTTSLEQVPTLVLPPQAGHSSCIVDFAPGQSQLDTARQAGLERIFALDWLGANEQNKNSSIEDYLAVLTESVERLGGVVNLVGDCQGGWLAVIYAALYPDTVNSLTIAGAPVDFHAGGAVIHEWMGVLSPRDDLEFYRRLVQGNDGVLPGHYQLAGFITMQPEVELDRQLQLLVNITDPAQVARYRAFETWFKHTQAIPGAFYLWIVEHLFQRNELVAGCLTIGDRVVNLADITCPLYLLAGSTDHITPGAQVFALSDYAGTPPAMVHRQTAPGGHLGLFMGHEALDRYWAPLFNDIAQLRPAKSLASDPDEPHSRQ